jgi:hypothetical protein
MDLSKILEQNKEEIRETDSRKQQALQQFREMIEKHPFITNCYQGNARFLSEKKN